LKGRSFRTDCFHGTVLCLSWTNTLITRKHKAISYSILRTGTLAWWIRWKGQSK